MKALTSSCSKAIFSPRVSLRVSDRPELCFSLCSKNEKKGYNLWLLKLVRNNGVYPVHAVPPKDQVDLETAESQAQQTDQTNESKFVRVEFQLQKNCNFGEQFLVVGDDPLLGSWDPLDALPMTWSDGHVWTVELDIPAEKSIQFKFILKQKGGSIIWQPGSDRTIQTWETKNKITVCEDWENKELQKIAEEPHADQVQNIIEEDQVAQPNEETQVDSEVSTFTEILDNSQEGLDSNASEISAVEDIQVHEEEKAPAEPVIEQVTGDSSSSSMEKPMTIVAENISSLEDLNKSASHKSGEKNILEPSEESEDSLGNEDMINDLGINGSATSLTNQEKTITESRLFDSEGGPALVPGLILPPTVPNDEASKGEVQEITSIDPSVEAFETQDQNIPELSKEQENDDATPQEIDASINNEAVLLHNEHEDQSHASVNNEAELLYNEHEDQSHASINNEAELLYNEHEYQSHLSPVMEDRSNYQPDDGNPMQNDIKWGQETVKKFLAKLGFL